MAEAVDEPWRSILLDHKEAFETVSREITAMAETNRDLLTIGLRSARETLLSLEQVSQGYSPDGAAVMTETVAATGRQEPVAMSGGFSSLNTALSALRYNRVAMDVAGSEHRQRLARRATPGGAWRAPPWPAPASPPCGRGTTGPVTASPSRASTRMTDALLDVRGRREHGNQAYLDVRQASLERIENGIGEPGDTGVAAAVGRASAAPGTT